MPSTMRKTLPPDWEPSVPMSAYCEWIAKPNIHMPTAFFLSTWF